jgi:hypothetical protein
MGPTAKNWLGWIALIWLVCGKVPVKRDYLSDVIDKFESINVSSRNKLRPKKTPRQVRSVSKREIPVFCDSYVTFKPSP